MTSAYVSRTHVGNSDKVLTDALSLVGLSMIPTALAAWLVSLVPLSYYAENPGTVLALFIGNFIVSLGLMFWAFKSRNSGFGVVAMLLFATSMGAMMGPMINKYLAMSNGVMLIASAAAATGAALIAVTTYIKVTGKDFSFLGSFLFGSLIILLVMSVIGMFFHSTAFQMVISCAAVIIFLGYLLFDVSRVVHGGETNYIIAAISIYLDLINLFIHLLQIFGILSSSDD